MTQYTLVEARKRLGDIVRQAAAHERSVITDHNAPAAMVVNVSDWEDMEDALALAQLQRDHALGVAAPSIPWNEAKATLLAKMDEQQ